MKPIQSIASVASDAVALREQLARNGVLWVRNVISPEDVAALRQAVSSALQMCGHNLAEKDDVLLDAYGLPRKLCYPLSKHPTFLHVLAHPGLGQLVEDIAGPKVELVLTWEDVVLKPPSEASGVPVHQDLALQTPSGFVASFGIHLHDSAQCPVWFLPGSHLQGALTQEQVRKLRREVPFIPVAPSAGDIVIHDVHCVHYSEPNPGPEPRDTWYLEFRDLATLIREGPWPPEWAEARRAILFHAAVTRQNAGLKAWWPSPGWDRPYDRWPRQPLQLRVPHVGNGIEYDLSSAYHHFGAP